MKWARLSVLHLIDNKIHFYKKQRCLCSFKWISVYMMRLFSSEHRWYLPTKYKHGESRGCIMPSLPCASELQHKIPMTVACRRKIMELFVLYHLNLILIHSLLYAEVHIILYHESLRA